MRFSSASALCSRGLLTVLFVGGMPFAAFSQTNGDDLLGKWFTDKNDAIFEFYCVGAEYRARLIPLRFPELKDARNPVDSLKPRRLSGVTLVTGLYYNDNNHEWHGGKVYNPEDGRTYQCCCMLKDNGQHLVFRGFLGINLLGKSQIWRRADK